MALSPYGLSVPHSPHSHLSFPPLWTQCPSSPPPHSHLIPTNLDFVEPTQGEDPIALLETLKLMVAGDDRDETALLLELENKRHHAEHLTKQRLRGRPGIKFRWLLWQARYLYPAREESAFYVGASWPVLRRMALELGQRFTKANNLHHPEDIFYLQCHEIEMVMKDALDVNDLSVQATDRRVLRDARKRLRPPMAIPADVNNSSMKVNDDASDRLEGFAVSPGTVTGIATVILSPEDFNRMRPGTILVCELTTPAWTQLFSQAKGLVTDIGGITAHGSIVAREFGIPAVLGTGTATSRIKTGQTIRVDGDAGTVEILGSA